MTNFFARPEIPLSPNPEPPGFSIIRALLMSKILGKQANPWGLTDDWNGSFAGNPLMAYSGRGRFDPRTGNRGPAPWESAGPPSGGGGAPGGGGRTTRTVPFRDGAEYDGNVNVAPGGTGNAGGYQTQPWFPLNTPERTSQWNNYLQRSGAAAAKGFHAAPDALNMGTAGRGPAVGLGGGGLGFAGTPPPAGTPNPAGGPSRGPTQTINRGGATGPPSATIPGNSGQPGTPGSTGFVPPPAAPPTGGYDFGPDSRRGDFWNHGQGFDGRVPYPNENAPMPDGRYYDAAPANPNTGTGTTGAANLGAPMSPWLMPWMGDFTAPMSPEEQAGLGGMSDFVTGGMGLGDADKYVHDELGGKYIGAANPYMKQIEDAMGVLKGRQDETGLRRIGSAYGAAGSGLTGARMSADTDFQLGSDANYNNIIGQMRLANLGHERDLMQGAVPLAGNLANQKLGGWGALLQAGGLPRELQQHDMDAQYKDWTRQIGEMRNQNNLDSNLDLAYLNTNPGSHQPGYAPSAAEGWAPIVAALLGATGGTGSNGWISSLISSLGSGVGSLFAPGQDPNVAYPNPVGPVQPPGYDPYNPWDDYSGSGQGPGPYSPDYGGDNGGVAGDGRPVYDGGQDSMRGNRHDLRHPPPMSIPGMMSPEARRVPFANAGGNAFWNDKAAPGASTPPSPMTPTMPAPRRGSPMLNPSMGMTPSMGSSSGGAIHGKMQPQPGAPAESPIRLDPMERMGGAMTRMAPRPGQDRQQPGLQMFDGGSSQPMGGLLQALLQYLKQNPGPGGGSRGPSRVRRPTMGGSMSPEQQQSQAGFWREFFNPGRTGRGDSPTGPTVFQGFTRGENDNPRRNPGVGDTSFLRGGNPGFRSSSDALREMTGQPGMNDMGTWLSDIYAREGLKGDIRDGSIHGLPDSVGHDPLFGDAPRFGPGSGDDWAGFFGRGSSLESIDQAVRGGGWGTGGGLGGRIGGGGVGRGGWDSANFMM